MFGIFLVIALAVMAGWGVARQISDRRQGHLICGLLSIAAALLVCVFGTMFLFAIGWLELSGSEFTVAAVVFNSWMMASWLSLIVIPIVLACSIYEQRG